MEDKFLLPQILMIKILYFVADIGWKNLGCFSSENLAEHKLPPSLNFKSIENNGGRGKLFV